MVRAPNNKKRESGTAKQREKQRDRNEDRI